MIGYLIILQVFVAVIQARHHYDDDNINELFEYDANLSPGFDIDAFLAEQLNSHNQYRALHGVPLMTLDPTLTEQAKAFAEQEAAKGGEIEHCKDVPECDPDETGENLFQKDEKDKTDPTKDWYAEFNFFNYCHGDDPTKFNRPGHEREAIGHFTQIVWKASVLLGIGYAQSKDKQVYVVARYKPQGNVGGQYGSQVTKPSNLTDKYQDNCYGIDGGYSSWSGPGQCTRNCGGGVRLLTKYCNNPKPSLNGRDCEGLNKKLAVEEWCNIEKCEGTKSHRELQCEARGYLPESYIFEQCSLNCYQDDTGKYLKVGKVDDGTHCNDGSGVCVLGVCQPMPKYAPPRPTSPSGATIGSYTETPGPSWSKNVIFSVPEGATNIVITNEDYKNVKMMMGYKEKDGSITRLYQRWMESWNIYPYEFTIQGVTCHYDRVPNYSTITIAGPVQLTPGSTLLVFVEGSVPAQISWSYSQ